MVGKLGVFIDGRWRSLKSLAAEGRALGFVVVRRGVLMKLTRPPQRSRIRAGLPLHFKRIKRSKDIYKPTDKNAPIFKNRKRQQPLTEVEIHNKYSKSSPIINTQNLKAYKSFPQSKLQKAYKSVPEYHNNIAQQEKGIAIKDSSEDESSNFLGKENEDIPKKDAKNSNNKLAQNANKHTKTKRNDDKVTVNSKENVEKENKNVEKEMKNVEKENKNVQKENISEDNFKVNQQPSRRKRTDKSIESSVKSSTDNIRNAEKKLENENSKRKDFYKNAQPSTSKGIDQNLQSSSSLTNDKLHNDEDSSKRKDFYKKSQTSTSKGSNKNLQSPSSQSNDKLRNDEDSAAESESSRPCLELVVEPEDLELMRQCLIKEPAFKVDVDRFDKDELYQQRTLFKLQPVVHIVYLKLGLHHQLSVPPKRAGTVSKGSSLKKKSKSSATTDNNRRRRRSPVRFRKSSVRAGREYSSLEDHAIVSWLSASPSREHAVNGNRVWRELQTHHARLTGQDRTWHSLRNRYLRYILPGLAQLALPPSHAQRLRAAAATGEIKSRKKRPPSILVEPTVRAAHRRACVRPSIVPSDTESDGNSHHKKQDKNANPSKMQRTDSQKDVAQASSDDGNSHHKEQQNKKTNPSKKQRTEPKTDAADDSSSDDSNLHQKEQHKNKKRRTEPQKDAADDSSSDDGMLHHKVQRPSLRPKNKNASPAKKRRTEPQKDASEDSSDDDGILHHKVQRPSLRSKNKNSSPSKKRRSEPLKDASEDSSDDDGILHQKVVQRPSLRSMNKNASPAKKRRSEPKKYVAEDSSNDDEAKMAKKTASKRPRDSEGSDSDDAPPLELSRLRPRPSASLRRSDGSGDDKSYDPPASKKKRRRLFNP